MKWALVENSVVQNVITPPQEDYTPPEGQTVQPINDWVDIGQSVDTPAPVAPAPTAAQQAAALIADGVVITSLSNPSLNGAYACDAAIQMQLNAVITYILVNNAFPGGLGALPWPDMAGAMHTFTTTTEFQNFASAIANFVAVASIYASSNGAIGSLPSNALTIP